MTTYLYKIIRKHISDLLSPDLRELINRSLEKRFSPEALKKPIVSLIYKSGDTYL